MIKNYKYKIIFISSMIIFGTLAIFIRNINVSSGELALYRAILAIFVVGLFLLITKQKINFKKIGKEILLLIFSGMVMGLNWVFLFEAYKYTTVSIATLSYYFAPVIVTIVSPLLFKEKLGIKGLICFIFSTIGIVLITGLGDQNNDNNHLLGILFGLLAAIFYATVMILNKFTKTVGGIQRTFLQFIFATIILIPYVIFTTGFTIESLGKTGWINLLIVGIIHTGITYCMYFSSLKELPGQNAAILSYVDPLVAIIISVFALKESITPIQIIGGLLILIFAILNECELHLNINKNKK